MPSNLVDAQYPAQVSTVSPHSTANKGIDLEREARGYNGTEQGVYKCHDHQGMAVRDEFIKKFLR